MMGKAVAYAEGVCSDALGLGGFVVVLQQYKGWERNWQNKKKQDKAQSNGDHGLIVVAVTCREL